jgi:RND family efflux transporter MFP subunit
MNAINKARRPAVCSVLLVGLLLATLSGCSSAKSGAGQPPPPVTISQPLLANVTDHDELTGRTEAIDSVQVRARVTGYLDKIYFQDGNDVQAGDVLYLIDPRPYVAQVDQDKADLVAKQATVVKTEAVYKRSAALVRSGAASQEDVQVQRGDWEVAKASVGQAEAKLRTSQLYLDWTRVISPISGQLSRTLVTKGNLVTADQTVLTNIVSLDPIYAYFDVDEPTVLRVQRMIRAGKHPGRPTPPARIIATALGLSALHGGQFTGFTDHFSLPRLPVAIRLADEDRFVHQGSLDFVNSRIDPSTGTLQIRGVFDNPLPGAGQPRVLSPGMFVRVRVPIGMPHEALLISERALAMDQGLSIVFVVNDKNEVERREVVVGQKHDGLVAIEKGLKPTDRVIISGLQRVRSGTVVNPKLPKQ